MPHGAELDRLAAALRMLERPIRWRETRRPEQVAPPGEWLVWLVLAGRGWGKTRTGAEDVAGFVADNPRSRMAVVGRTFADVRDVCVEGESGLLAVIPEQDVKTWNRSQGLLVTANGSRIKCYTAEKPDALRGPQHHRAWLDELAHFDHQQKVWANLLLGLRLGRHPQAVVTTTPRPTTLIRELVGRIGRDVVESHGSTFDNLANLAPTVAAEILARYEGTSLGRQEIHAELLMDVPGALWTRETVDAAATSAVPEMLRVVVGVDPNPGSSEQSGETGIVVVGMDRDLNAYVLADRSLRASPDAWGREVVAAYNAHKADAVIAER